MREQFKIYQILRVSNIIFSSELIRPIDYLLCIKFGNCWLPSCTDWHNRWYLVIWFLDLVSETLYHVLFQSYLLSCKTDVIIRVYVIYRQLAIRKMLLLKILLLRIAPNRRVTGYIFWQIVSSCSMVSSNVCWSWLPQPLSLMFSFRGVFEDIVSGDVIGNSMYLNA